MKIIISPAKKMNIDTDTMAYTGLPKFYERALTLYNLLQEKSLAQLQALWACNDKIAMQNRVRLDELYPDRNLTPALLAYEGIQYQYMSPVIFSRDAWEYAEEHLRILSGLYGILKPFDGVIPYRLEMQAKCSSDGYRNLYEYWGRTIYDALAEETDTILNLASGEYSKVIEKYLTPEMRYVTCIFGELQGDKVKVKGTMAKMARGEMVRFVCEEKIEDVKEIKKFRRLDYCFSDRHSDEQTYVFLKAENRGV